MTLQEMLAMTGLSRLSLLVALCTALAVPPMSRAEEPMAPDPLMLPMPADLATRQISVTVDPGLTRTRSLPTEDLRAARRAMLADEPVTPAQLQALADRRDGLAAQRLVRHLLASGGSASDIAHYGSIAVATGRIWSLPAAVAAMRRLDPATEPPERVKGHAAMLYPHAWAGNTAALDALIDLNGEGRLFGPLSDRTRAKIEAQAAQAGDGRSFLHLALVLLRDPAPDDAIRTRIRDYLVQAQGGTHLGVRTTASALLARLEGRTGSSVAGSAASSAPPTEADLIAAEVARTLVLTAGVPGAEGAGQ
jgi:hypothetical protein